MMTRDIEKDLVLNFTDFFVCAEDELRKKKYNPAVSSYFKAATILCDLNIYRKLRLLPKNHAERFSLLETHFPEVYELVAALFKKYTDSYDLRMEKEDALLLKENVEKLKGLFKAQEGS